MNRKGFFFKYKCVCLYEVYFVFWYKFDIYLDEKEFVNFLIKGNWKFYWGGLLGKIEWILNKYSILLLLLLIKFLIYS